MGSPKDLDIPHSEANWLSYSPSQTLKPTPLPEKQTKEELDQNTSPSDTNLCHFHPVWACLPWQFSIEPLFSLFLFYCPFLLWSTDTRQGVPGSMSAVESTENEVTFNRLGWGEPHTRLLWFQIACLLWQFHLILPPIKVKILFFLNVKNFQYFIIVVIWAFNYT